MKVTGNIKQIFDTVQATDTFKKREFVVTTNDMHPQDILIQMVQDKTGLLDAFKVGQDVEVDINLRGREWTSPDGTVKYFNTIEGWRISEAQATQGEPQQQEEPSDLPF